MNEIFQFLITLDFVVVMYLFCYSDMRMSIKD